MSGSLFYYTHREVECENNVETQYFAFLHPPDFRKPFRNGCNNANRVVSHANSRDSLTLTV